MWRDAFVTPEDGHCSLLQCEFIERVLIFLECQFGLVLSLLEAATLRARQNWSWPSGETWR